MTALHPADSAVETTHIVQPPDSNFHGTLFGGRIMAWMDMAAAISASRHCRESCVTVAVDDLVFERAIRVGMSLLFGLRSIIRADKYGGWGQGIPRASKPVRESIASLVISPSSALIAKDAPYLFQRSYPPMKMNIVDFKMQKSAVSSDWNGSVSVVKHRKSK